MSAEPEPVINDSDIVFNEDITILGGAARPHMARPGVSVYAARGTGRAPDHMLAFVCGPDTLPRTLTALNYRAIGNANMLRLVASGGAVWEKEGVRKFCLIYEEAQGKPLLQSSALPALGMKPDAALNLVAKPLISALYDLHNSEIPHGAIRPDNIFATYNPDNGALQKAILGDCLALPCGFDQPVLYETIARGMADPAGRGVCMIGDDLYALGATLAVLMRQEDPLAGLDDEAVIRAKFEQGSFSALLGKENIAANMGDLLRGLLNDDPNERWTLQEVESWLEGRRLGPKNNSRKKKAARPLLLNNEKYFYGEMLAMDFGKNPSESIRVIENGEFEQWVTRALGDSQTQARVAKLSDDVDILSGPRETRGRRLLSCMSIALHPEAPLRFDTLRLMPGGFGASFSHTVMAKGNIRPYLELIQSRLVVPWLEVQEVGAIDISHVFAKFDACRNYLNQAQSGFGFERCLYEMDHECPCLSDKVIRYGARSAEELLAALDELVKGAGKPVRLFDRHITAFLLSRERKYIEPNLPEINAHAEHKKIVGELRTLATLQKRIRAQNTPNLARWYLEQMPLFLSRIHDREEHERLAKQMEAAVKSGNLSDILDVIDNPRAKRSDIANFLRAMRDYQGTETEERALSAALRNDPHFGRSTGRNVAAALSGGIALLLIAMTFFAKMSGGMGAGF